MPHVPGHVTTGFRSTVPGTVDASGIPLGPSNPFGLPPLPPGVIGEFGPGGRGLPVSQLPGMSGVGPMAQIPLNQVAGPAAGPTQDQVIRSFIERALAGPGTIVNLQGGAQQANVPPGTEPTGFGPGVLAAGLNNAQPTLREQREFFQALPQEAQFFFQARKNAKDAQVTPQQQRAFFQSLPPQAQAFFQASQDAKDERAAAQREIDKANAETGLFGAEQAIESGLTEATDVFTQGVAQGRGDISEATQSALSTITEGAEGFSPFLETGQAGQNLQAALAGILGPEAQAQALQDQQESPLAKFIEEQQRRQLLAGAAATGGLGSGETQRELLRLGTGLSQGILDQQFGRAGEVAGRGLQAATGRGNLFGQGAGIQATGGRNLADLAFRGGTGQADLISNAAAQSARNRFTTGTNLADAISGVATGQADLLAGQGRDVSNIAGAAGRDIARALQNAGVNLSGDQLAILNQLVNLDIGQGSQLANRPSAAGFLESGGIAGDLAKLAEGAGTAIAVSDARLKTNIIKIGSLANGLGVYIWDWTKQAVELFNPDYNVGVIAQEVEKVIPEAVVIDPSGFLKVDYARLA